MRMKSIVSGALLAFIALAVVFVARDAATPKNSAPAAAPAAMVTAAQNAVGTTIARVDDPLPQTAASPVKSHEMTTRAAEADHASASESTAAPASPSTHQRTVVATYFHGNIRCTTCRKVEAYAREAVEEGFAPQIASGVVAFRAVNVDDAENRHFVEDYQLTNKSVVVTDELDGRVERWVKLDDVWSLVGNRPAYVAYVQDGVRGYLETR